MRTTIDLPDDLFREAKVRAALSGLTLKQLITLWVERGLREASALPPSDEQRRRTLPVIIAPRNRQMPVLSNAQIEALLETEDAAIGHDGQD